MAGQMMMLSAAIVAEPEATALWARVRVTTPRRRNGCSVFFPVVAMAAPSRRHLRRRDFGPRWDRSSSGAADGVDVAGKEAAGGVGVGGDRIVVAVDFRELQSRAAGAVLAASESARSLVRSSVSNAQRVGFALAEDGAGLLSDLRSAVSVRRDSRLVFSVRRSSLAFLANALFCMLLALVAVRILIGAARKYRWGWEESFQNGDDLWKRDRSLGGKEVVVSRRDRIEAQRKAAQRIKNPLDGTHLPRSEKELLRGKKSQTSYSGRSTATSFPSWWPDSKEILPVQALDEDEGRREASALMRAIMDKRLSGLDFEEDDILKLHRICKYSGTTVKVDTQNVRDSLYRAAVNFVLSSCSRYARETLEYGGETAASFLAGLASHVELEAERAATIVNAAVAARTRSTFLQAWALHMQGKDLEADEELMRLCRIHMVFPPENGSAEIEMVAQGLGRHLSVEERKNLLQMYVRVGGNPTQRIASEALGLSSTRGRV